MKPFREMNTTVIGAAGVALILGGLFVSFNTDDLPVIGYRDVYQAEFTEAAGLKPADEVRVAGIKVGKVTEVELAGDRVLVTMRLRDVEVGSESRADIRIKTVLGRKFVALTPEGPGTLDEDDPIPLERTSSPYDVAAAFQGLADTIGPTETSPDAIDTDQLAEAFGVLADTFRDTPDEVQASLVGLSRLSDTIASRDAQLRQLLDRSRGVTDILARRDQDLVSFLDDTNLVLEEIRNRRVAIDQLLTSTTQLADQLTALVRENRAQLQPTLERLRGIVGVLKENQDNLDQGIAKLAPFVRVFGNNLGNGRWFDTLIYNLPDLATFSPASAFPCGQQNADTETNPNVIPQSGLASLAMAPVRDDDAELRNDSCTLTPDENAAINGGGN